MHDLFRNPVSGGEERTSDHPVLHCDVAIVVTGHHAGLEPVFTPREPHGGQLVHCVVELGDHAAGTELERKGLARTKALQFLSFRAAGKETQEIPLRKSNLLEYAVERVAVADHDALHRVSRLRRIVARRGACRQRGGVDTCGLGGVDGRLERCRCRGFRTFFRIPGHQALGFCARCRARGRLRPGRCLPDNRELAGFVRDELGRRPSTEADDQTLEAPVVAGNEPNFFTGCRPAVGERTA